MKLQFFPLCTQEDTKSAPSGQYCGSRSGSAWIRIKFSPQIWIRNADLDPDPAPEILAPKAKIYYEQRNFNDKHIQMVKVSSSKTKLKYSPGAEGSPCYLRIITERSFILVFSSLLLAKFMDPDPHKDFPLDPDPKKIMRIRHLFCGQDSKNCTA